MPDTCRHPGWVAGGSAGFVPTPDHPQVQAGVLTIRMRTRGGGSGPDPLQLQGEGVLPAPGRSSVYRARVRGGQIHAGHSLTDVVTSSSLGMPSKPSPLTRVPVNRE